MTESNKLIDTFGRIHKDLRVSLTDRCSLRCTYCMPFDFNSWIPSPSLLKTDELIFLIEVATTLGIKEVRLTGGEPMKLSIESLLYLTLRKSH
jgi:cyclic pyranopterin phosphate synthase